jgi:hypothetical protein
MNTFSSTLYRKTKKLERSIVAQRLKRFPTIVDKLKRYPNIRLSQMQDIGGIRAICKNLHDMYYLYDFYHGKTIPHDLYKENNYIDKPKQDGYRGIHLIFKYKSSQSRNNIAKNYEGLKIEVQLRTTLQHLWATGVEIVGLMRAEKLKSQQGDQDWLDFFALVSKVFAEIEFKNETSLIKDRLDVTNQSNFNKQTEIKNAISEIKKLNNKLKVVEQLQAFSTAMSIINKQEKQKFLYIIIINTKEHAISIKGFSESEKDLALKEYAHLEASENTTDQVLVKTRGLKQLKKAYPNYFADTTELVNKLKIILDK